MPNKPDSLRRRSKFRWYAWFFPLIALVITGTILKNYYHDKGPVIKIRFNDASGIQAEKTRVRYRGVTIGTVRNVYITDDMQDVVAEIILKKEAAHFAREGSRFSLVVPKVTFQGISGLETLFEGAYISVLPGAPEGNEKTEFTALAGANISDPMDDTTYYIIETASAESLNPGDAVTFKGLKVGTVTKLNLSKSSQEINVQINLENKYAKLIRSNTFFWKKVGIEAKLGFLKAEFKMNSIDSVVNSGIEFSTPDNPGPMVKAGHRFTMLAQAPKDWEKWNPKLQFQSSSIK